MKIPSEGCWRDSDGYIYRHSESSRVNTAFQKWFNNAWRTEFNPGIGPWTPCPDPSQPEYRDAYRSKEWALSRLNWDKILVTEYGSLWRFSAYHLRYERCVEGDRWAPFEGYSITSSRPQKGTW